MLLFSDLCSSDLLHVLGRSFTTHLKHEQVRLSHPIIPADESWNSSYDPEPKHEVLATEGKKNFICEADNDAITVQ